MAVAKERELLLRVAERLSVALGYTGEAVPLREVGSLIGDGERGRPAGVLDSEDELLVLSIRRSLEKVAAAASAGSAPPSTDRAVATALDGAELVMRGELASGRGTRLPALMPSFVFLVTLPIVEQDEAIELSRRTSTLIAGALGSDLKP